VATKVRQSTAHQKGARTADKSLALELAPAGVRVNAICPADCDAHAGVSAQKYGEGDPRLRTQPAVALSAEGECPFIHADEIAQLIEYCVRPAHAITGAAIPIDFGVTQATDRCSGCVGRRLAFLRGAPTRFAVLLRLGHHTSRQLECRRISVEAHSISHSRQR